MIACSKGLRPTVVVMIMSMLASTTIGVRCAGASQTYTDTYEGYTVTFPNSPWEVQPATQAGAVATIRNFPSSAYGPQGCLPEKGAEIRIIPLSTLRNEHAELAYMSRFGTNTAWSQIGPPRVDYTETTRRCSPRRESQTDRIYEAGEAAVKRMGVSVCDRLAVRRGDELLVSVAGRLSERQARKDADLFVGMVGREVAQRLGPSLTRGVER